MLNTNSDREIQITTIVHCTHILTIIAKIKPLKTPTIGEGVEQANFYTADGSVSWYKQVG
jgi:hypothetical protein